MNRLPAMICLIIGFGSFLSACGGLLESDEPADSIWWLEPVAIASDGRGAPRDLVLHLEVVPGLDTDRILNLSPERRLNYYAGAHWPDDLPDVMASLIHRTLERSGDWRVREGSYARTGECLLTVEVQAFYGRLDATGITRQTEGELHGSLDCPDSARAIESSHSEPVSGERLRDIARAFQSTLDALLIDALGS